MASQSFHEFWWGKCWQIYNSYTLATLVNLEFGWVKYWRMAFVLLNSLKFSPTKILHYTVLFWVNPSAMMITYSWYVSSDYNARVCSSIRIYIYHSWLITAIFTVHEQTLSLIPDTKHTETIVWFDVVYLCYITEKERCFYWSQYACKFYMYI